MGLLFIRLPASVIGVALFRFAASSGTVATVWLERGYALL
jgi:putative effector of murein hydrolase LrgA (UPF0299 family)